MKKFLLILFISLCISLGLFISPNATAQTPVGQNDEYIPGQVLVKFRNDTSQNIIDTETKKQNGKITNKINKLNVHVVKVPQGSEEKVIAALSHNPNVEYAELDYTAHAIGFPSDAAPDDSNFAANQWGLENTGQTIVDQTGTAGDDIDARAAWQITTGTASTGPVKVAVLDTGIDQDHPDISSKIILQKDFSGSGSVNDLYGHGTHVSGIIAAKTNNATGVAGACPDCTILNGKVLNNNGSGANSWIANGIIWAADNGAKVINMSLGGPTKSITLENAVNYAWNKQVVITGAAGNSGNQSKTYPGAYTNVISVAATDNRDNKASFSEYGSWVNVAAPGVNIFSTFPNHQFYLQTEYGRSQNYDFGSGTSMATPMTSAVAALIWSTGNYSTASAVRNRLELTADKITGTGTYWKSGRINAVHAVDNTFVPPPTPTPKKRR